MRDECAKYCVRGGVGGIAVGDGGIGAMRSIHAGMLDWRAARGAGVLSYSGAHFLCALVLLFILAPFVDHMRHGRFIEAVMLTVVMVSAVMAVGARKRTLVWSIVLLSPVVVARWADHIASDATPDWVFPLTGVVFVGFVAFHLFRYMLLAPRVNTEVLCTGVAMFLTLAMWWAFAYVLVGQLIPDSFAYTTGRPDDQHMQGFIAIYFSLVTLCTVGFGDIVPVSGPARMLAMLEGVTGVFYVAIMVARLVSMYSTHQANGSSSGQPLQPGDSGTSTS